jgi:hypothetical protein
MYVRLSRRPLERFQPRARLVGARRGTASWLRCLHRARRACLRHGVSYLTVRLGSHVSAVVLTHASQSYESPCRLQTVGA